jgi:ribonuclease D
MTRYELIDLNCHGTVATELSSVRRIGLDTEFMREKTFFAELCLVQLSIGERIYCADPLGATDLGPFWEALTACEWVLHSGRQDMEVIYQASGRMPERLFDTQIAAALLGYAPQLGYAGLVEELFDVELAKSHTRADWARRPLSDEVGRYAAEDVEYLLPAFDVLNERLDKLGRRSWVQQDSVDLLDRTLYEVSPGLAIERVKGARNLQGASRAAAAALAEWREKEALRRNRPRQWILRDAVLLEIAQARPESSHALRAIPGLPDSTAARAGDELLSLIGAATNDPTDYKPPQRPDERQKALLKQMQKLVSECARELGVSAEIVAPRKELSSALTGTRDSRVFRGWRLGLAGERLLALLENA